MPADIHVILVASSLLELIADHPVKVVILGAAWLIAIAFLLNSTSYK